MKDKNRNPIMSPLHRGRIIIVLIIATLAAIGVAAYETYNLSMIANAII